MPMLLLLLMVWVTFSVLAAVGFCLLCTGARSRGAQDLAAVTALVPVAPDRAAALV